MSTYNVSNRRKFTIWQERAVEDQEVQSPQLWCCQLAIWPQKCFFTASPHCPRCSDDCLQENNTLYIYSQASGGPKSCVYPIILLVFITALTLLSTCFMHMKFISSQILHCWKTSPIFCICRLRVPSTMLCTKMCLTNAKKRTEGTFQIKRTLS